MYRFILFALLVFCLGVWWSPKIDYIKGVVWQPTLDYNTPNGAWEQLGADSLLVQWSVLNKKTWIADIEYPMWQKIPDWSIILQQRWSQKIILGLSGDFDLTKARQEWHYHKNTSVKLYKQIKKTPFINHISGWYAPIEIDPSWNNTEEIKGYLDGLPMPLYISSFVGRYNDPYKYALWVKSWLPKGATLLFQDSVGTKGITPKESLSYINALKTLLGEKRVVVILEAFTFRYDKKIVSSSTISIANRLLEYKKLQVPVFLFSCRYVDRFNLLLLKSYLMLKSVFS